jgi:DinB superfamily
VARSSVEEARARLEATLDRAASFTEDQRHQRVDDEWSTVESLRHLVLVIDLWLSRAILGVPDPFDPMALPPTFMPPTLFPGTSIDPAAAPTYDEVCDVLNGRIGALCAYVDTLTDDELVRAVDAHVGTVGGALAVVFNELSAHDRFINRDLDALADGVP